MNSVHQRHKLQFQNSKRTYRLVSLFSACLFLSSFSFSQVHWKKVDSLYQPLPSSIHIFKTADSINGKAFIAYYISAKLKDKKLFFTTQTGSGNRYTPLQYYQQERFPLVVVNCSFFSIINNQNLSVIIKNGKIVSRNVTSLHGAGKDSMLYYYVTRSALGIDKKGNADVAWTFTHPSKKKVYAFESAPVLAKNEYIKPDIFDLKNVEWKWWRMQTAVGGGPTLGQEGEINITDKEEQIVGREDNQEARTAMGYTKDNRLIILVIQGGISRVAQGATFDDEASILKSLGCYEALNLDGGANSYMLINGKETIRPSDANGARALPAVFLIKSN